MRDSYTITSLRAVLALTFATASFLAACGGEDGQGGPQAGRRDVGQHGSQDATAQADMAPDSHDSGPPLPAGCANGAQDPGEAGIDCGGTCPACLGEACASDDGCATGYCAAGSCAIPTCNDGISNGGEAGVDCGGPCPLCEDGQACGVDTDCLGEWCQEGRCRTSSCSDGVRNQDETDVDCGGVCPPCPDGGLCHDDADCLSGVCFSWQCRPADPSCGDGVVNGSESDVDCGGVSCAGCALGKLCGAHDDCLSLTCMYGVCAAPGCDDELMNGSETGVDCGGSCAGCADGVACEEGSDCQSWRCEGSTCVSCSDGLQSGAETGVDCGGPCAPCATGAACQGDGDCATGLCHDGHCCQPNACGACGSVPQEVCDGQDNDCDGQTDEVADIGAPPPCPKQAGVCAGLSAICLGADGWTCTDAMYEAHDPWYDAGAEASCDQIDNDCDGWTDEDPGICPPPGGHGDVCYQGECCMPKCYAKDCGDDSCGGVCDVCGSGTVCDQGQCKPPGCGSQGGPSCWGLCGGYGPEGSSGCRCGLNCQGFGDCCPDYFACCY
jgi:hypothetical protein